MNSSINFREASEADVPAMAKIRAREWETEGFWTYRISSYMNRELHPGNSLPQRTVIVAIENDEVIGFIAGHRTTRLNCDGELQWINVLTEYQGRGIASELLRLLASWFIQNSVIKVCVDPDDSARKFYAKHGAKDLDQHWMFWNDITKILKTEE